MTKHTTSSSQLHQAFVRFRRNRGAMVCVVLLGAFYLGALFADFLAPYTYDNEDRNYSYCPPTPIQFWDEGKLSRPFVYGRALHFDEFHKREFVVNPSQKYYVQFLTQADGLNS